AFAANSKDPEGVLVLIAYLARHGQASEAITLCAKAWQTCSPEAVASTCMRLIHADRDNVRLEQQIESWLTAAIATNPKSEWLPTMLADLKMLRGPKEAI